MKNKTIRLYSFIFFLLLFFNAEAQDGAAKTIYTADSIKSGNSKDILTNFFQLAFNNLAGPNKEFGFSSNPYAIMLKKDPGLNKDIFYKKYKPLRKLNFSFGVRLDSSFNFNGFTSGLKYSLIDQTDVTASKVVAQKLKDDKLGREMALLNTAISTYLRTEFRGSDSERIAINTYRNSLFQEDKPLSGFNNEFQNLVRGIVKDKNLTSIAEVIDKNTGRSLREIDSLNFVKLKNSIKNNLLWTVGVNDSTYKDKFQFANIAIVSELTKGVFEPESGENNFEINIKAMLNFSNDTVNKRRNLDRQIFSIESGLNWVWRDKTTDRSFFEIKFSGSYYRNFGNPYPNEKKDSLTINGTARIRIINDIWIPLEVKYDPKTGKIFGFLNLKANFWGIGALLKGKNS